MKLLKFILSLETFFCSSCFLAIFSPENQKREWDKTKNWKFLVRSPTPARVLKQLSSCLRLQMKKTKFSSKMLFRAWKANSFDTCFASFICHLKAVLWAITVACHARLISRLQQFTKLLKLRYSFIPKSDRSWNTFCPAPTN